MTAGAPTLSQEHAPGHRFPPLRLGPVSRVTAGGGSAPVPVRDAPAPRPRDLWAAHLSGRGEMSYPRIIVRDPMGRTLDTFTALQDAIYRASWARKKFGEWPKTQLEWRLPKAPVPSRPDYSRSGPFPDTTKHPNFQFPLHHGMTSQSYDGNTREIKLTANVLVDYPTLEIPVDDVAFVAESLNHLPELPSFTFLRHSILTGQSTYVQIVASLLLHQRQLMARDVRQAHWSFPGFCTGCKRAGFCYGCEKNSKPHVHEDIPARTGGGFRFWKHDRPRGPQSWKNPSNWCLPTTEDELEAIIEKYGDLAAYERARHRAESDVREENQSSKFQRLKNLSTYPPYVTIVSTIDLRERRGGEGEEDEEEEEDESTVDSGVGEESTRLRRRTREEEMARRRRLGVADLEEHEEEEERLEVSPRETTEMSEASTDRILYRMDTDFVRSIRDRVKVKDAAKKTVTVDNVKEVDSEEDEGIQSDRSIQQRQPPPVASQKAQYGSDGKDQGQTNLRKSTVRIKKTSRLEFLDKAKETEAEEEARLLREPPKFFQVQKKQRKATVAKDPFSTERDLNLPTGPTFELKKSNKKATQFVDFKKADRGWKAPKKFEVVPEKKKTTKFWTGSSGQTDAKSTRGTRKANLDDDGDGSKRKRAPKVSSDSGFSSGTAGDGNDGQEEMEHVSDLTDAHTGKTDGDTKEDSGTSPTNEVAAPVPAAPEPVKPKRKEVVKKVKVEKQPLATPPRSPPRLPSPPTFKRRSSPTPPTPTPPQSPAPERVEIPLPNLDLPEVPDLPEIEETVPEKRKQKLKFLVEPPPQPQVTDTPKKRRAPPKIRHIPKHLSRPRKSRPAEAPVTAEELIDFQDPLDFLAKYCIINPDRLPYYEIVFESALAEQTPRYSRPAPEPMEQSSQSDNPAEDGNERQEPKEKKKMKGKSRLKTPIQKQQTPINPQLLLTQKGMNVEKVAMTLEEQNLEKLIYTLDLLQDKMNKLCGQLEDLEVRRTELLAHKARVRVPEITSPNFVTKSKKNGKKGKKKNKEVEATDRKLRPEEITNDVIVSRLDGKMLKEMCQEPDMKSLESEIEICKAKFKDVQHRLEQIAAEKLLADAFCMNHYFLRQEQSNRMPAEYRRQQSEMFNRLRPNPDLEMNLEEVEESLQQINNHLLTEKEFYFLFSVLNLPRREKINFRLFTIIAALSEKVTQLDPVIRKLINNVDYNALDIKMEKCKELFQLLESEHMPKGSAQAASLAVELTAGGLKPEHTHYVMKKFNRDSKGFVDFLDFVTYVPLFVEIHKRIVTDPLNGKFDL